MSVTLFGINNCDTVKKAMKWLKQNQIDFDFYDYKKQPITAELINTFLKYSDWSVLFNKRSTSYRQLPDSVKNNLTDAIMFEQVLAQPTLLKRPILMINNQLLVGFKEQQYQEVFQRA